MSLESSSSGALLNKHISKEIAKAPSWFLYDVKLTDIVFNAKLRIKALKLEVSNKRAKYKLLSGTVANVRSKLNFELHSYTPLELEREFVFSVDPTLNSDFFLSSYESVHSRNQPVMLCDPEFEHDGNDEQVIIKRNEEIQNKFLQLFIDSDPRFDLIRSAYFEGILKFLEDIHENANILSANHDSLNATQKEIRLKIEKIGGCTDFSSSLFTYKSLEYYAKLHSKKAKKFINVGDPICCICFKSFCTHILSNCAPRTSKYTAMPPIKPCSHSCYMNDSDDDEDVEFDCSALSDFGIEEIKEMVTKTNSPCLVARIVETKCKTIYSINPHVKHTEQAEITKSVAVINYKLSDLYKPCVFGENEHPNLFCENPCIGLEQKQFTGCNCIDNCSLDIGNSGTCSCAKNHRECNPSVCKCCDTNYVMFGSVFCRNLNLSRNIKTRLEVKKSLIHNYGLFAAQEYQKFDFIGQYTGEMITEDECLRREPIYGLSRLNYMFDISIKYSLDSNWIGCETRFANDSGETSKANAIPRVVFLANGDRVVGLYASKKIEIGVEICFSYGKDYYIHA
eukprot:NODE_184_length_15718_cov_0.161342.p1 type:complete len:566 gc:universal NODE_184_length_15718_cov_0.161342:7488-5791(-)